MQGSFFLLIFIFSIVSIYIFPFVFLFLSITQALTGVVQRMDTVNVNLQVLHTSCQEVEQISEVWREGCYYQGGTNNTKNNRYK